MFVMLKASKIRGWEVYIVYIEVYIVIELVLPFNLIPIDQMVLS